MVAPVVQNNAVWRAHHAVSVVVQWDLYTISFWLLLLILGIVAYLKVRGGFAHKPAFDPQGEAMNRVKVEKRLLGGKELLGNQ